jgi:predicted N-acetyltransferase YhbS
MNRNAPTSDGSCLHFRLAEEADQKRLIALINAAFSIETFFDGTRTDDKRLSEDMRRGCVLIAEDGSGRLLGCIYTEVRGTRGYLGMLAVDPASQRAHIGRRIVGAAEEHLRRQGCKAADLVVLSLRDELPPIYRKFGYIKTGTEVFHATQPLKAGAECHGIVMSKLL